LVLRVNGVDRSIPVSSDPNVCGGLRAAAALVVGMGGFEAKRLRSSELTVRIGLSGCAGGARVQSRISALAGDLLQMGMDASENEGTPPCCIPAIRVYEHGAGQVDVDLYVERTDARGQAFLETAARAILPLLERVTECQRAPMLQVFSIPVAQIRVSCRVDVDELIYTVIRAADASDGSHAVRSRIDDLMRRFCSGSHQPELAARHNDHLLAAATGAAFERGLDTGRFVLGARAHAARWGSCEPLANWRRREGELIGQLQLPQSVGGHSAQAIDGSEGAARAGGYHRERFPSDLLVDVACVGLVASLGFLRQGLPAQNPPQRRRTLLPPPLPAHARARAPRPSSEKCSSESGVRPAVRAGDISRARTGSDPY
jgi:hydroxymethylglutaryl-CoA reductase